MLGPFAAGTREFGADPLEAFGGIRTLYARKQPTDVFPSELVFGGYVNWTTVTGDSGTVNIGWDSSWVNWPLIEGWGGLTASQFRGWAVGRLQVSRAGTYVVSCSGVTEYFIGERQVRGDVYGLGYGLNSVYLTASSHTIYVPFSGMEGASFQCSFADAPSSGLLALPDNIAPDIVVYNGENTVAGGFFGLTYLNLLNVSIDGFYVESQELQVEEVFNLKLAPHQAGIVSFRVVPNSARGSAKCTSSTSASYAIFKIYAKGLAPVLANVSLTCRQWGQPYAFSFLDVDDSVQYAATRPPVNYCAPSGCPVLFTFHGAGVYARKDAWVYAYKQQESSWLLFPTNRRQFGFDWEGPGHTNAWKSLAALSTSLPGVPSSLASKFALNPYLIQYAGHSMGGHGCWYISTHAPDRALSISPAAGWIKMGMYIPFFTRVGDSLADPHLQSILMSSISMHNTDFYLRNIKGLPLMVRMGADDNNVPPYHLKRMARLHNQIAATANATVISEVPGESHWWGGVVDDPPMQNFFDAHFNLSVPALPSNFTITLTSPADFESRGGIQVMQLFMSGRAGYIHVNTSPSKQGQTLWNLRTSNIRRFQILPALPNGLARPNFVVVDGDSLAVLSGASYYYKSNDQDPWRVSATNPDSFGGEKSRESIGPIARILEGPITIVIGTRDPVYRIAYEQAALMLANTLYYQGRYTPRIALDSESSSFDETNLIVFGSPRTNTYLSSLTNHSMPTFASLPVSWGTQTGFTIGKRDFSHTASGLAFITPVPSETNSLQLVIDGNSVEAFRKAAGLVPTKSSWTVPDWVVTGPEYGWNGAAGLLGAGYWSNNWQFEAANSWVSPFDEM